MDAKQTTFLQTQLYAIGLLLFFDSFKKNYS